MMLIVTGSSSLKTAEKVSREKEIVRKKIFCFNYRIALSDNDNELDMAKDQIY